MTEVDNRGVSSLHYRDSPRRQREAVRAAPDKKRIAQRRIRFRCEVSGARVSRGPAYDRGLGRRAAAGVTAARGRIRRARVTRKARRSVITSGMSIRLRGALALLCVVGCRSDRVAGRADESNAPRAAAPAAAQPAAPAAPAARTG